MYENPDENMQVQAKCLPFFKISPIYAKHPFLLISRMRAYLWKMTPFFRESGYECGICFDREWGRGQNTRDGDSVLMNIVPEQGTLSGILRQSRTKNQTSKNKNCQQIKHCFWKNKANLRDLIAATGLVILLKLDSNHRFFSPCDLEIWRMTFKNNRAPLLCYFKLCTSFQCHRLIQTGVTVRKRLIWVKIDDFFSRVTLKFNVWPWKTIEHLFYATSSFLYHFVAIGEFKLELQSGNAQSG